MLVGCKASQNLFHSSLATNVLVTFFKVIIHGYSSGICLQASEHALLPHQPNSMHSYRLGTEVTTPQHIHHDEKASVSRADEREAQLLSPERGYPPSQVKTLTPLPRQGNKVESNSRPVRSLKPKTGSTLLLTFSSQNCAICVFLFSSSWES